MVLPRTLSDHSPLLLVVDTPKKTIHPFTWRFPPYLLLDPAFKNELAEAIETFFATNIGSVDSFQTVWETFKVYIRGVTMAKHSGVLRSIWKRLADLEHKLKILEKRK